MKPTRPSSPGGGSAGDPSRPNAGDVTRPSSPGGGSPAIHPLNRVAARRSSLPGIHSGARPPRRSRGFHHRLNRVAARRSSLRFGRNTLGPVLPVGAPPSRALSAGRLPGLGAHLGSTTGCSPRRCAPLIVAFRSEYARASSPGGGSSLTRLVSRTPTGRTGPRPHREDWPTSALTRVPPPAEARRFAALCVAFRSKYTRYSSLTRLVSRAPPRSRRSRGFHHRQLDFTAFSSPN